MKKTLILSLAWGVLLLGGSARAQTDPNPGKTRALQLRDRLTLGA